MICAARWFIRPHPATCSDGTDAPEKRKVGGFDPAPDHQFGEVISEFSQLRGANWEALTTCSRAHRPPEARSLPATKAAGGPMNILSGQRVTHGACTRDDGLLRSENLAGGVSARAGTDRLAAVGLGLGLAHRSADSASGRGRRIDWSSMFLPGTRQAI